MFYINFFWEFLNITKKTPVIESNFSTVACWRMKGYKFTKSGLHHGCTVGNFKIFSGVLLLRLSMDNCFRKLELCTFFITSFHFISPWTQDVNWTYIRRSEDTLDVFWTSYIRLIYILCPGGLQNLILNKGWQEEVDIYKRSENDFSGSKPATYLILDPTQTIFKKFCDFFPATFQKWTMNGCIILHLTPETYSEPCQNL